ncbi:MAG: AmmeMemoRadiSam system protein B [Treponema sp.]|jgi:AmmeMemoRadiSam system protein B|nr:AmmeMemoRadiSam system protein B [Treponema sp.]
MQDFARICERTRSPVVGGLFYPEAREETEACLASYRMEQGNGGALAILAPHGCWDISGAIAGEAFAAAGTERNISRVVVLGPIHKNTEDGLFLTDSDCFLTPLGGIRVDGEIRDELASCSTRFEINDIPHLTEHSIEVLLPFIKYRFPGASIVPILMGGTRPSLISALGLSLRLVLEPILRECLIVISCNFAMDKDSNRAFRQAEDCIRLLLEKNAGDFGRGLRDGMISACGGGLIAGFLESGIASDLKAEVVSRPVEKSKDEKDRIVYYGALSYG